MRLAQELQLLTMPEYPDMLGHRLLHEPGQFENIFATFTRRQLAQPRDLNLAKLVHQGTGKVDGALR